MDNTDNRGEHLMNGEEGKEGKEKIEGQDDYKKKVDEAKKNLKKQIWLLIGLSFLFSAGLFTLFNYLIK